MSDTANNDRPRETPMISRKKLDEILPQMVAVCYGDIRHADGTELTHKEKQAFADSVANRITHELAKAAAYDEAMEWLSAAQQGTQSKPLDEFMREQIASGRFKP